MIWRFAHFFHYDFLLSNSNLEKLFYEHKMIEWFHKLHRNYSIHSVSINIDYEVKSNDRYNTRNLMQSPNYRKKLPKNSSCELSNENLVHIILGESSTYSAPYYQVISLSEYVDEYPIIFVLVNINKNSKLNLFHAHIIWSHRKKCDLIISWDRQCNSSQTTFFICKCENILLD